MIRIGLLAACGLISCFAASEAQAQKLEYDCDTGAQHFSQLKLAGDAPSRGITGKIAANQLYKDSKYTASAHMRLTAGKWSVALDLSGLVKTGPKLMMGALTIRNDGAVVEEKQFDGFFDASAPLAFALTIDGGAGTATLGDQTLHFAPPASPTTAEVTCSTGEFLFSELELAR